MASYNRIVMVGNLTRDPDYKQLSSGQGVCRLGLASNRQFKNRQSGESVQEVCFIDVDVWGPQAESCRQYLQKGRQVLIEGRIKYDTWQDATGQTRSKHTIVADRVVFLNSPQDSASDERDDVVSRAEAAPTLDSNNPAERELMSQIEQIRTKMNAAKSVDATKVGTAQVEKPKAQPKSSRSDLAEMEFKDEPPFQDDLPF